MRYQCDCSKVTALLRFTNFWNRYKYTFSEIFWNECQKEINVKKTKVMVVSRMGEMTGMQRSILLDGVPLEQIKHFKYLGSWITDDAKSDEDIKTRVGMAKA